MKNQIYGVGTELDKKNLVTLRKKENLIFDFLFFSVQKQLDKFYIINKFLVSKRKKKH